VPTNTVAESQKLAVDEEQISNGANDDINVSVPYVLNVRIIGVSPILFHAWSNESVAEKAAAQKGSKQKKTDNLESYVYRDENGNLGVPGRNLAAAVRNAGKFMPDPRSPRRSAHDLCKAGVIPLTVVSPLVPETKTWDFDDAQRVTVQRNGITRVRPAMREGWEAEFDLLITTPEYLSPAIMSGLISQAGRLVGLCDFRPTYGRFNIKSLIVREP
jgi:hypothetical protein